MLVMNIEQVREALDPYEKIVFDNSQSFIERFCGDHDVWDLTEIHFSSSEIKYVYVHFEGQHIVNGIDWDEFKEWLGTVYNNRVHHNNANS